MTRSRQMLIGIPAVVIGFVSVPEAILIYLFRAQLAVQFLHAHLTRGAPAGVSDAAKIVALVLAAILTMAEGMFLAVIGCALLMSREVAKSLEPSLREQIRGGGDHR